MTHTTHTVTTADEHTHSLQTSWHGATLPPSLWQYHNSIENKYTFYVVNNSIIYIAGCESDLNYWIFRAML